MNPYLERKCLIMVNPRKTLCRIICLILLSLFAFAQAETAFDGSEQGLDEIQPLIEMAEVEETEGMSLEEMTDAVSDSVMSEYYDSATGFSMQYPSVFQFSEGGTGSFATTADQKAMMTIENMPNEGRLSEDELITAIRLEIPDARQQKNEKNGCLRFDRTTEDGAAAQTDLYFLTKRSFHHIVLRYPSEEQETYYSYIDYMINTMETDETDLG